MKQATGWWFGTTDRKLLNDDGRAIKIGETHKVKGRIIPCEHGLHLSNRLIDALRYAPGPVVYKVRGSGTVVSHGDPIDKLACSHRTYLSGGVDVSDILWHFARLCALDVIHLWEPEQVVLDFLKTGDEKLRASASASAWASARAWDSAWAWKKQNTRLTKMVSERIGG